MHRGEGSERIFTRGVRGCVMGGGLGVEGRRVCEGLVLGKNIYIPELYYI